MSEYTPTTDELREAWHSATSGSVVDIDGSAYMHYETAWKNWLAEHNKEVAARAVRDAADDWIQHGWIDTPHYVDRMQDRFAASQYAGDWLKQRADQEDK